VSRISGLKPGCDGMGDERAGWAQQQSDDEGRESAVIGQAQGRARPPLFRRRTLDWQLSCVAGIDRYAVAVGIGQLEVVVAK